MRFALHQALTHLHGDPEVTGPTRRRFATGSAFLRSCAAWQFRARIGARVPWTRVERLTVILLSFKRVRNLDPIARSLACLDCVNRIVVCNNNPAYRMADWISLRDPRLSLRDQAVETYCGIRFQIARRESSEYFLAVDDDVFLQPEQAQALFEALLASPDRVHGIRGQVFPAGPVRGGGKAVERRDADVDVLNQVYAFTRRHVEELFRIAAAIGESVADCIADDMLVSFAGEAKPRCHEFGKVLRCLSARRVGLASYRTLPDFQPRRARILEALRGIKPELGATGGCASAGKT